VGTTNPQNEREAAFTYAWYSVDEATRLIHSSIENIDDTEAMLDKDKQSWLFNRLTTLELLRLFAQRS